MVHQVLHSDLPSQVWNRVSSSRVWRNRIGLQEVNANRSYSAAAPTLIRLWKREEFYVPTVMLVGPMWESRKTTVAEEISKFVEVKLSQVTAQKRSDVPCGGRSCRSPSQFHAYEKVRRVESVEGIVDLIHSRVGRGLFSGFIGCKDCLQIGGRTKRGLNIEIRTTMCTNDLRSGPQRCSPSLRSISCNKKFRKECGSMLVVVF